MSDALETIAETMCEIVSRIYFPLVTSPVMMRRKLFTLVFHHIVLSLIRAFRRFLPIFTFLPRYAIRKEIPHLRIAIFQVLLHP